MGQPRSQLPHFGGRRCPFVAQPPHTSQVSRCGGDDVDAAVRVIDPVDGDLVDAQIGYSVTEGPLSGLSVNLSGSNLTNEPFVLYQVGAPAFDIIKYEKYGAVYSLSLRYKF